MIRSIFIGFLILSALTTKGAEAQIAASTRISAAALKELISAVSACAGKAASPSCESIHNEDTLSDNSSSESIRSDSILSDSRRIINCSSFESINSHILSFNNNNREVFIIAIPSDGTLCLLRGEGIQDLAAQPADKGIYCCRSGLSPPC